MDLGDAMARSAGWKEEPMAGKPARMLPPIEARKQGAPTANNRDNPWSVGVMNLTAREADDLVAYARTMQRDRTMTATEASQRRAILGDNDIAQRKLDLIAELKDMERGVTMYGGDYDKARRARVLQKIAEAENDERTKYLTGDFEPTRGDVATAAEIAYAREYALRLGVVEDKDEPVVQGNRFSGLDIE